VEGLPKLLSADSSIFPCKDS
jgi:hypothetical protein